MPSPLKPCLVSVFHMRDFLQVLRFSSLSNISTLRLILILKSPFMGMINLHMKKILRMLGTLDKAILVLTGSLFQKTLRIIVFHELFTFASAWDGNRIFAKFFCILTHYKLLITFLSILKQPFASNSVTMVNIHADIISVTIH